MSIKIDKSAFTAEELAQYEALIAKAKVDPEAAREKMEEEKPPFPPKKKKEGEGAEEGLEKSASPELTAALERLATLEKSYAMKEYTEIAKKYAPLGEKEDQLAQTLYDMKKSNPANYDAYIAILDKSLGMVEKSGVFAEIGKSAAGGTSMGTVDKINTIAKEIMKSDSTISEAVAISKAWEQHPELVHEYEAEFYK